MQLHPGEIFTITHQLNNPAYITDTSYVRAVIRNAKTDTILSTKNLTDQGSGRFTTQYKVPSDVSGQGFWISIVTTVYSDSGYTTQSLNYGVQSETYLIQDRFNHNIGLGGGGGVDIDYKKIKTIVDGSNKNQLQDIGSKIESIEPKIVEKQVVKEIRVPEVIITHSPADLSPVIKSIEALKNDIGEKHTEMMKIPKLFDPLEKEFNSFKQALKRYEECKVRDEEAEKELAISIINLSKKLDTTTFDVNIIKAEGKAVEETEEEIKKKEASPFDPRVSKLIKKS